MSVAWLVGTGSFSRRKDRSHADLALRCLFVVSVSVRLILSLPYDVTLLWAVGLMFWLRRKRFVGSYSFFRATNRP